MRIISGVYWDQGGRASNQDSLTLQQVLTRRGRVAMAAVSDGIGGLSEGEIASGYITERLTENFYGQMVSLVGRRKSKKAVKNSLLRCFCDIHEELKRYAQGKEISLGATVSLLFIWKKQYVIFHLGDSRIYLYHRGKVKLLTKDHSDGGHGVTKCMGSFPFRYPDIQFGSIHGRSGFLLCTDGFYRTIDEKTRQILLPEDIDSDRQAERRLKEMARAAKKKGESDNLSAVYLAACREGL